MATNTKSRKSNVIKASGAVTATAQSATFDEGSGDEVVVMLDVTAVSGTTPSMTVTVQWTNNGTDWFSADPADTFTALTAAGKVTKSFVIKGVACRLNYAITGTTPSFTFSAHAVVGE